MLFVLSAPELSDKGRCPDIVVSIHLEVAYALQGSFSNPQARIIGVLLTTGVPQLSPSTLCLGVLCSVEYNSPLIPNNVTSYQSSNVTKESKSIPIDLQSVIQSGRFVSLELVSSVVFLDMTKPAEPLYPEMPNLDLELPYDFFYPYLPSAVDSWHASSLLWSSCILCALLNKWYY